MFGQIEKTLWLLGGRWLERKGIGSLAEACYRNGADGYGKYADEACFLLSQRLLARDRNADALVLCEQALQRNPKQPKLWLAMGAAKRRLAQMDGAREAYERALELDPGYAKAWCNLGEWWLVKNDLPSALAKFEQALKLQPDLLEALNNRVAVLYELSRFDEAEAAANDAIALYPEQAALYVNLGNIQLHAGKSRLATISFRKALELDSTSPEALLALSTVLGETRRLGEALAFIEHEIAVKGESAQRLASLAMAQQAKGDLSAAETTCNKILAMQPSNISALITLSGCYSARADHQGAIRLLKRALAENPRMSGICSSIAFNATYLPETSAHDLFDYHRLWASNFETDKQQRTYADNIDRNPDRPLRIAYVSGDFGTHPVGFLLRDVISHHDHDRYIIYCYSMMRANDKITDGIQEHSDVWVDVLLMGDEELAKRISEDKIDILIDLSGHTAYNRLTVFVLKPAPIQATWIGYFHSTGLESIDYFITDPFTTPKGSAQLFSETPVYLPYSRFCYSPPDYAPEVAIRPLFASGIITFASFNRIEKLVDPVIAAWSEILKAVPNSRLLLKSGGLDNDDVRDRLRQRFVDYGLDGNRIELRGPSSHPDMLQQYGEVDIALDPFPFNGGMTTLEALWMGVPVVTIEGESIVSRQTVSALSNLGLADDLAFKEVDSYIKGAAALALDPDRLAVLSAKTRPLMAASPICQPERFTRDLESLYRKMWRAWCEGRKLESDPAKAD